MHAKVIVLKVDMESHVPPPTIRIHHGHPDRLSGGRLPRWCSLPIPGTSLVVSDLASMSESIIWIDKKRAYSIGGSRSDDIFVTGLRDVSFLLMHHISGSVFMSTVSSSPINVTASLEGGEIITINCHPAELPWDTQVDVCGIRLSVRTRSGPNVLRDCLRNFCIDDDQTHVNTLRNMSEKSVEHNHEAHKHITRTPSSLKRMKRLKPNNLGEVVRSVKFLDM